MGTLGGNLYEAGRRGPVASSSFTILYALDERDSTLQASLWK